MFFKSLLLFVAIVLLFVVCCCWFLFVVSVLGFSLLLFVVVVVVVLLGFCTYNFLQMVLSSTCHTAVTPIVPEMEYIYIPVRYPVFCFVFYLFVFYDVTLTNSVKGIVDDPSISCCVKCSVIRPKLYCM